MIKMAEIATSEVLISTLPTKEVTLAPKQAIIVREIHTTIQPGQNEITILGLDPRVNSDSIRIEGSDPATITDIQTSLVPQPEDFYDFYPSESDGSITEEEEDISEDEDGLDDPELQDIRKEIEKVEAKIAGAQRAINASVAVLGIMNEYGKGLQKDDTMNMKKLQEFLDLYTARHDTEGERNHKAVAEISVRGKELAKLQRKFNRRKGRYHQERLAASKAIRMKNEKRARGYEQKIKQRDRKRTERNHFWTQTVGQVVVSLDSQTAGLTPGSSQRSSAVERAVDDVQGPVDVVLRLSYIVPESSWASRYDLAINSPSSSARMTYRAEIKNSSSETWRDTRVTLSTSQASFSGIGARIPSLDAWNIKLVTADSKTPSWDRILDTPRKGLGPAPPAFPGNQLFSKGAPQVPASQRGSLFANSATANTQAESAPTHGPVAVHQTSAGLFAGKAPESSTPSFGISTRPPNPFAAPSNSLFGGNVPTKSKGPFGGMSSGSPTSPLDPAAVPKTGPLFGEPAPQTQCLFGQPAPQGGSLFGQAVGASRATDERPRRPSQASTEISTIVELEEDEKDTQSLASSALEHQDSIKQDGMTTTYELPGRRTLAPSFVSRRHVLAELDLKSVTLTYVIVPKHREAAFLRARVKNSSSLTLHPGPVGITVDGSFVGTANLEACGPNVFFNLSLGVDPGIEVKYAKPVVKPLTGAMFFNKEDGAKFHRSCWVKNTKTVAVDLLVSDQIPVSDDEKLRVHLLQPAGLEKEGDVAPLQKKKCKGNGTASLLKNGEVKWTLRLEPREEIRLVLEYEAKVPSGSDVISG
ncbi:hypothetical protein BJX76DRAFT_339349 [Aspergillus varians]